MSNLEKSINMMRKHKKLTQKILVILISITLDYLQSTIYNQKIKLNRKFTSSIDYRDQRTNQFQIADIKTGERNLKFQGQSNSDNRILQSLIKN